MGKPQEKARADAQMGQIIPFPQKNVVRRKEPGRIEARESAGAPPSAPSRIGPRRKERPASDFRRRMVVNASACVLCALLVAAGVWMATTMAELRRREECALVGGRHCAPPALPYR